MKYIIYLLPLFILSCSDHKTKSNSEEPIKIDSTWQKKTISDILTISLPDSSTFNKNGVLNASFGNGKFGLYGIDYFDTAVVYVQNEDEFKEALKGYLAGKFTDLQIQSYELNATDTTIGNSTGYFLTGYTTDSISPCKYPFCYLTLANDNFYWFYACQPTPGITNETRQFFHSIQFDREKLKEANYQLPTTRIRKRAGFRTAG